MSLGSSRRTMAEPRITLQQRRIVHERARGCCEYCRSQIRFAMASFVVDHIVPRSAGGASESDNLALACPSCNAHKYNKTSALDPLSGETLDRTASAITSHGAKTSR
jgi:5-methylcytosine-specific restriction endonuclease McrA